MLGDIVVRLYDETPVLLDSCFDCQHSNLFFSAKSGQLAVNMRSTFG